MNGDTTATMAAGTTMSSGMMGMGREKMWTTEIWAMIDQGVKEEVERVSVAQKMFPVVEMIGEPNIADDVINVSLPATLQMHERQRLDFVELSVEFRLTTKQMAREAIDRIAMKLARLAAIRYAQAMDRIVFNGRAALPGLPTFGAYVTTDEFVRIGMLFENLRPPVFVDPNQPPGIYPERIFGGVTEGIADLHADGQNESFGCVLHFKHFADAHQPTVQSLVIPADRILGVIREDPSGKGGFHPSEALILESKLILQEANARLAELKAESKNFKPSNDFQTYLKSAQNDNQEIRCGLLAAQAGQPTKIYIGKHAVTEFNQTSGDGRIWSFRVTGMFQYRSHDPRSLLRIEFRPDKARAARPAQPRRGGRVRRGARATTAATNVPGGNA